MEGTEEDQFEPLSSEVELTSFGGEEQDSEEIGSVPKSGNGWLLKIYASHVLSAWVGEEGAVWSWFWD